MINPDSISQIARSIESAYDDVTISVGPLTMNIEDHHAPQCVWTVKCKEATMTLVFDYDIIEEMQRGCKDSRFFEYLDTIKDRIRSFAINSKTSYRNSLRASLGLGEPLAEPVFPIHASTDPTPTPVHPPKKKTKKKVKAKPKPKPDEPMEGRYLEL